MNLRRRAQKIKNRAILNLSRPKISDQVEKLNPRKPIRLRKYAKTATQAPTMDPPIQNQVNGNLTNSGTPQAPTENHEKDLNELYTNIKSIPNYTAKLAEFLRHNKVHSTHRRIVKKKFPRRKIIVHFPFQIFMADLIEYLQPSFKHANRNYGYIYLLSIRLRKWPTLDLLRKKTNLLFQNTN